MYSNNRDAYRQAFYTAWQKHLNKSPLEPVEAQLVDIIQIHPQYHALLKKNDTAREFDLEENPYFHMSLHLAIEEQIRINQPRGVGLIYQALVEKYQDKHQVLHLMMVCLSNLMWESQQIGSIPDENE